MADTDVSAVGLASPPAAAPRASYTPAVTVRNNGIHDATASGYLRVFDKTTGVLLHSYTLTSGTIHPGSTGLATANGALDLSTAPVGKQYIIDGLTTTPGDMVPANNVLPPVIITVSDSPPPPPPPVEAHASQHEDGGSDTLSVDGLTGKLASAQDPTTHATAHQLGGDDVVNVAGLSGELADPQPPKAHASAHEPGGDDELAGIPALAHAPTHGPEGSDPIEAAPPLAHASSHELGGADPITGIPPSAHQGTHQVGGGDELNVAGLQGELASPQTPIAHASSHAPGGSDPVELPAAGPHAATHQADGNDVINVGGLPGQLLDEQIPLAHDNNKHDPPLPTAADVAAITAARVAVHDEETSAHGVAENLEQTNRRGQADGYCELDELAMVPASRLPSIIITQDTPAYTPVVLPIQGTSGNACRADNQPSFPGLIFRRAWLIDHIDADTLVGQVDIGPPYPPNFAVRFRAWGRKYGPYSGGRFTFIAYEQHGASGFRPIFNQGIDIAHNCDGGVWNFEGEVVFMTASNICYENGWGRLSIPAIDDDFFLPPFIKHGAMDRDLYWNPLETTHFVMRAGYTIAGIDYFTLEGAFFELVHSVGGAAMPTQT